MDNLDTVAIVGLGYVGLPLAIAFGASRPTIGFDLNEKKLDAYRSGRDPSGEVEAGQLASALHLRFTHDPAALAEAAVIIVVVPTPIDHAKRPDLTPLERATRTVGLNMSAGATVVFESTVYPGCTEEVCVPILVQASGLAWLGGVTGQDANHSDGVSRPGFHVGYSPERINPGDKEHRLENVVKVVAGDTPQTLEHLAALYATVAKAGVYRAKTIQVAEAAKVIENTQRDLNIALMNELAMIFNRLDIDTLDVLEAAGTKWNFLPFKPGLVGGHCIGVDPYYLTYKAESAGFHPQAVLGGRRINDGMGKFIAEQTVKQLASRGQRISGARITILGLTFKEDCSDLRNSRVPDIIKELREYGCEVMVHDPVADAREAQDEYAIVLKHEADLACSEAIVLAVAHRAYLGWTAESYLDLLVPGGVVIDVKGVINRDSAASAGLGLWRL